MNQSNVPAKKKNVRKGNRRKDLLLRIGLGAIVFVALVGVVLGLSVLFGAMRKSEDSGEPVVPEAAEYDISQLATSSDLPHETERFAIEYVSGEDKIVVHMFPDLLAEGTIEDEQARIKVEATEWLLGIGVDASAAEDAGKLEWSMK